MAPDVVIKGYADCQRAIIKKDTAPNKNGDYECQLLVEGYGFKDCMTTPGIEPYSTKSNHVMEVNQVLGIEAVLADGSYLALLHPRSTADGPPITVRVIEYTVHSSSSDGTEDSSEVFALVTDLLDSEAYPALDLACAYPMRWEAETVIGHHKTDMGEGMPVLRSKDPEGVAQEMWALFAVYQAIHTLIGAAVDAAGIPPEKISFPHALAAATDTVTAGSPPSGS